MINKDLMLSNCTLTDVETITCISFLSKYCVNMQPCCLKVHANRCHRFSVSNSNACDILSVNAMGISREPETVHVCTCTCTRVETVSPKSASLAFPSLQGSQPFLLVLLAMMKGWSILWSRRRVYFLPRHMHPPEIPLGRVQR